MFGAAMVLAAAALAAGEADPVVHGEMGAVHVAPTATATAPQTATATATPSTSTSTSTSGTPATANPTAAPTAAPPAAPTAAPPAPSPSAPAEAASEQEPTPAAPAAAPEHLGAAPAGPPLADSRPILLARRAWSDGGAIERLIEPSGDVVVHAVTPAGTVLSCTKVGSLYALPILTQTDAAGGEVVHVVRDDSGAVIRYVVQVDGEPRAVTVLGPAQLSLH